jgi:chaperone BCS1
LLEYIDALFVERKANDSNKSMVSFSGILNVMDGIARKHRLITFMTTNYPDRLDEALKRPGRIDYQLTFDYATKKQIKDMYANLIPDKIDELDSFMNHIRNKNLTMASLQKYLFDNRKQQSIMKNISDFDLIIKDYNKQSNSLYS